MLDNPAIFHFSQSVCLIPCTGFSFFLTNPVMGGFQGTFVTAQPSVTDEGWNSQKRPYKTLANNNVLFQIIVVSIILSTLVLVGDF